MVPEVTRRFVSIVLEPRVWHQCLFHLGFGKKKHLETELNSRLLHIFCLLIPLLNTCFFPLCLGPTEFFFTFNTCVFSEVRLDLQLTYISIFTCEDANAYCWKSSSLRFLFLRQTWRLKDLSSAPSHSLLSTFLLSPSVSPVAIKPEREAQFDDTFPPTWVTEGDSLTLRCTIGSALRPCQRDVTWFRDGDHQWRWTPMFDHFQVRHLFLFALRRRPASSVYKCGHRHGGRRGLRHFTGRAQGARRRVRGPAEDPGRRAGAQRFRLCRRWGPRCVASQTTGCSRSFRQY